MGQVGLHGLVGLVVGQRLIAERAKDHPAKRAIMFGFVVGSLAPDLDYLAGVAVYPVSHDLAFHLHRSFSHSLLAIVVALIGFHVAAAIMQDDYLQWLGNGFAAGIAAHITLDIFVWFTPVDLFWPASVYGLAPPVNIWGSFEAPAPIDRLLGAAELAAFALYYGRLARNARALSTDRDMIPPLERMAAFCWIVWAVCSALALDPRSARFDVVVLVLLGVLFMPACFYLTWRLQATIEAMAVKQNEGASL